MSACVDRDKVAMLIDELARAISDERCCIVRGRAPERIMRDILALPDVALERPTGHCKDCKWWKDKDGVYRRGIGAESKCPINRREVMKGMGYCFMFERQESEEQE